METWLKKSEFKLIGLILLAGFLHGVLFVFLVPPWQHYDEPMHFEYAWMVANHEGLPTPGSYDWVFRKDLVRSMIEHDFYSGGGLAEPDPENLSRLPAGLQYPQLGDPPLYYLLASVPLRLLSQSDLATQLLAARFVSVFLLLVTVLAGWGVMRELTPPGSVWRFLVPLSLALLPGFVDLMAGVNNDVGAAAVSSVFLWGAVRLIRRGPSPAVLLWVLAAAAAAVFTKSTAYIVPPLAAVALLVGLPPERFRKFVWALVFGVSFALLAGLLTFSEPAYWFRMTSQEGPVRTETASAPHGAYALVLDPTAPVTPAWLRAVHQPVPLDTVADLSGQPITLGFWMWVDGRTTAGENLTVESTFLAIDRAEGEDPNPFRSFEVRSQPTFFAITLNIPDDILRIWIAVRPRPVASDPGLRVFYDGFILVKGRYPLGVTPVFADPDGRTGTWGEEPFENLLRNGSMERSWPGFRPEFDNFAARLLPDDIRPSVVLHSLFDQEGTGWYYREAGKNILQTFWGRFGWGHVPYLRGEVAYSLLGWASLLLGVGVLITFVRDFRKIPVHAIIFLGAALGLALVLTAARGAIYIFVARGFIPGFRYAFPVIIPAAIFVSAGYLGIARFVFQPLRLRSAGYLVVYAVGLLLLSAIAWLSIFRFYG